MDIFTLDEVISRIVLASDVDSIVELRTVNKQLLSVVNGCTALLCERDEMPVVKQFFRWCLMHSRFNRTRYSYLFSYNKGNTECRKKLVSLLEQRQFKMAAEFVTVEILDEILPFLFDRFGEDNGFMNWVKRTLIKFDHQELYVNAFKAALEHKNPVRMISRLWTRKMNLDKEEVLHLVCNALKATLDLLYSIDSLYPRLQYLEKDFEITSKSWVMNILARKRVSFSMSYTTPEMLLILALRNEKFGLCDLTLQSVTCSDMHLIKSCTTLPALNWVLNNLKNNEAHEIVRQALRVGCTVTEIQDFLERYPTTIDTDMLFETTNFFQFDFLLPLVPERPRQGNALEGYLMLLKYYPTLHDEQ